MKSRKVLDILLLSLLFLYIYNPIVQGVAFFYIIYSVGIAYSFLNYRIILNLLNRRYKVFFLLLISTVIILFSLSYDLILANNYPGISFWRSWIYIVFDVLFVAFPFFVFIRKNRIGFNYLTEAFVKISVCQAAIAILMFLFPDLKQFFLIDLLGYNPGTDKIVNATLFNLRGFGIGSGFLFSLPLFQAFSISLIVDKSLKRKKVGIENIFYIILITISILLNARIGLVVFPILLITYYVSFSDSMKRVMAISFSLISSVIIFLIFYEQIRNYLFSLNDTFRWVITGIELSLGFSATPGRSIQEILFSDHWHFPDKLSYIIFGLGEYIYANPYSLYKSSDIGYIRYIYYGGVFMLSLAISFFMYLVHLINKTKFLYLCLILLLLVAHFKGNVFTPNVLTRGIILLAVCSYLGKSSRTLRRVKR